MDLTGFPRSAPASRSHSRELDETSRSAASTPPPIVPVAAAPKDQTLYEALLRYHNENDSVSTDDSSARRRRNPKVVPAGLKSGDDDADDDDTTEDRKMPAKPIALKTPPANSIPTPTTTSAAGVTSTTSTPKTQPSSAWTTGINRKTFPPPDYVSPPDAPKPGIVHVSEPAIRPDSAMYIAAYGAHPSVAGSVPSPPAPSNGTPHGQQQSRDPYMGLSHSTHAVRGMDYARPPDPLMRHASVGAPDQIFPIPGGAGRPPDYMMNIGKDDHIGLVGQKTKQRNSKSPLRIFGGKRRGSNDKEPHDTTPPTGGSPAANWFGKQYPGSTDSNNRSSLLGTVHSAPSTFGTNPRTTTPATPSLGYPPPTQLMRSNDDNQSIITESSMDEDLRLALEISKQDTGNHHPPRPTPPAPRPVPRTQDNFRREAMSQARQASNSSLADLLLALKLSAEESGFDRRVSTNLDELLAFEMSQDSRQHMTDFVAAGITTSSSASTASSTNATSSISNTYKSSTPVKLNTNSLSLTSTGSGSNNPDEQYRILEKIREEREQRELEIALKASEQERGTNKNHPPLTQNNFLHSQQRAMEDWNHRPPAAAGPRPPHQRQNSVSSIDSEGRRQQLLERGTLETKQAIRSGQAHVVTCLGCAGRLQAPMSYSLVFCPKCHTISPA